MRQFFGGNRASISRKGQFRPCLEQLESRVVPCSNDLGLEGLLNGNPAGSWCALPAITDPQPIVTSVTTSTTGVAGAGVPLPALNSLPGAQAEIYLNFTGDTVASWFSWSNIAIPAFNTDADPTSFSQGEIDAITNIWRITSQNYAIFNINVTTVDPRTVSGYTGRVSQIDIGGNGSWTGGSYGGIASVGGLVGSTPSNPVRGFVFPANLGNGNAWYTSQATTHESGHTMGLNHQSTWSGGTKTTEYQQGPGDGTAPIMGVSYYVSRGMWWYGTDSNGNYQNDLTVVANAAYGLRTDEAGDTIANPAPLTLASNQVNTSGLLTSMTDVDVWSFTTEAGTISMNVNPPANGNLDIKMQLLDATGNVVVSWLDPAGLGVSWTGTVSAGSYRLMVASHGVSANATANNYGFDVGPYSITGTILTNPNLVAAPTNLTATTVSSSQINLSWADNAANETNYAVERSTDGTTWTVLKNDMPANSTTYSDTGLTAGSTYYYRVRAFNGTTPSDYSNQASASTKMNPPAAPSNLVATTMSSRQIRLTWTDNANNETGFYIERATANKKGVLGSYTQIAAVGAGSGSGSTVTYYDNTVTNTKQYAYRVRAYNSGGTSAYSNTTPKIAGGKTITGTVGWGTNTFNQSSTSSSQGLLIPVPSWKNQYQEIVPASGKSGGKSSSVDLGPVHSSAGWAFFLEDLKK